MAGEPLDTGIPQGILTTRGDLLRRGASANERVALGADNRILASDGTDPNWETLSSLLDSVIGSTRGLLLRRGSSSWEPTDTPAANEVLTFSTDSVWSALSAVIDGAIGSTRGGILYRGSGGWALRAPSQAGYVLTDDGPSSDPAWAAPATSAKPTASSWGAASAPVSLSADVQLDTTDNTVRFYQATAAGWLVKLPAASTSAPYFLLVNASTLAFTVATSSAVHLKSVAGNEAVWCVCDGDSWAILPWTGVKFGANAGISLLPYVTNSPTPGQYVLVAGSTAAATSSTLNPNTELTVPRAGTINRAVVVTNANTTDVKWKVWKNGVVGEEWTTASWTAAGSAFYNNATLSTSTSNGDEIAVEADTVNVHSATTRLYLHHETSSSPNYGVHRFAGTASATSRYFEVSCDDGETLTNTVTDPHAIQGVPWACSLGRIGWNTTTGDSTTVLAIHKAGVESETVTLTAAVGSAALTTTFSSFGQLNVFNKSGTVPGASQVLVEFSSSVYVTQWGGTNASAASNLLINQDSDTATTDSTIGTETAYVFGVPSAATAYTKKGGDAGEAINLQKNGVDAEALGLGTNVGGMLGGTTFGVGDTAIMNPASATTGAQHMEAYWSPL